MYENENYSGYSTYDMGSSAAVNNQTNSTPNSPIIEKKKSGGYFKKVLLSISLGLFFGIFAGVGFYAVQQGTDLMGKGESAEVVNENVQSLPESGNVLAQKRYAA